MKFIVGITETLYLAGITVPPQAVGEISLPLMAQRAGSAFGTPVLDANCTSRILSNSLIRNGPAFNRDAL